MNILIFLASLILVSDVNCLDPKLLSDNIADKKPIHVVTLTRMPADMRGDPRTEDAEYLPISLAEAATVFELTNVFLGGPNVDTIGKAHKFDESVFSQIGEIDKQLSKDAFVVTTARDALAADATLSQNMRDEILRKIQDKQTICITKHVKLNLSDGEKVIPLERYEHKNKQYKTLESLNSLLTLQDRKQLIGKDLINPNPIIFEYKLGNISLERGVAVKLEDVIRRFNSPTLKDTLKAHLYRSKPMVLKGYASISRNPIDYYKKLFDRGRALFESDIDLKIPCLLVVNEQFFGKNFIFPPNFSLLNFIPQFPKNVIACVNLLKEEDSVLSDLSTTPRQEPKDSFYTSNHLTFAVYDDTLDKRTKYFRNVSFYCNSEKIIQEYTKSSYCKEHDSAIKDENFAYLFGYCLDKTSAWSELISTQICYDMSSGARKDQENPSPIHVIQSNRLNIGEYVLHDSQKLEERNHMPGQPEVIIHSDPSWPEVFTTDHSFTKVFDLSSEGSHITTKLHYQLLKPKEIFRFFIGNNGYKNAYTITHWVLNEESQ